MSNKEQIQKLRDYAELAWASYGYFHLADKDYKPEGWWNKDRERLEQFAKQYNNPKTTEVELESIRPTYIDILNIEYNSFFDGDFSPLQAKRFFEKYDLLKHCPNTESGFSATLFQNKETKEYTLAIRGTELKLSQAWQDIITTDGSLLLSSTPLEQYNDMLRFYNQCKTKYPKIKTPNSLTLTGHSLGGCLAQLLALSLCDDKNRNNIKALYTYNAPGARKIAPHYDYIVKLFAFHSKEQQEKFIKEEIENIANRARDLGKNNISLESKIREILHKIIQEKHSQYYGITMSISTHTTTMMLNINAVPILADIAQCYETLAYNYTQHFKEDRNTPQNFKLKGDERYTYKLSIQDSIYHCESSNNEYKNKWYMDSPISKLGIKLGLHQDNQYSDTTLLHTINTGSGTTGDHSIIPLTQTLYFYAYLLELDSNLAFFESHLDKTIQSLNSVVKSIVKILYHADSYNKQRDEAIRTANDNSFDLDPPPNHLYATIDKTLFEATLKITNKDKFSIDEKTLSNMIDGILYLQDNNTFLKLLSKDNIQQADKNTNLAILLAIHERLFFISVIKQDGQTRALIQTKNDITTLLKHNATRTQIFCYNLEHIDDGVIKGYANEALKYYPQFKEAQ